MAWLNLATSGSSPEFSRVYVEHAVTASAFSGDGSGITGIVSASYALSASWAPPVPSVSASYAETASYFRETKTFGITIDGGSSVIGTGIKGDLTIPFSCNIDSWYLVADPAGSIVIDVWTSSFSNFPPTIAGTITGTEKPTLSSQAMSSGSALSTWSKSISPFTVLRFNVDSAATVTRVTLVCRATI